MLRKLLSKNSSMTKLIKRKHLFAVALILAIVSIALIFATQFTLSSSVTLARHNIPISIVEKSNQFIISKFGQDFFDNYIQYSKSESYYIVPDKYLLDHPEIVAHEFLLKPYYHMEYTFKMPEKPFVDELIQFSVDTNGTVIAGSEVSGIPDLINNPSAANFTMDEAQARVIAKNAGLEDGIADWTTSFHWFAGNLNTYVWSIQNTLQEDSKFAYSANGREIIIDANSGKVLNIVEWSCQS
jgi:hypothetical protein